MQLVQMKRYARFGVTFKARARVTPISGRVFPVQRKSLGDAKKKKRKEKKERRYTQISSWRKICSGKYAWTRPSQLHRVPASIMRLASHCDLCQVAPCRETASLVLLDVNSRQTEPSRMKCFLGLR